MIRVSENKQYFIKDGKKFFYLGDTVWSTFTNATSEEFLEYLEYRRSQGFNSLQINILPQWDRSMPDVDIHPFEINDKGIYNFYSINEKYFDRAEKFLEMAVDKGFIPNLVVLWGNYVKDTWISERVPQTLMPYDAIVPYVCYAVKRFSRFNPMYMISGDTDFRSEDSIMYYLTALKTIKELTPHALCTLHLAPTAFLPDEIVSSGYLDFYMYQSGHGSDQSTTYTLPEAFGSLPLKRPVLNGEPCYEGIGEEKYGMRFGRFHLRRATWHSLLCGAKAGITYGAHGIWNWHKNNSEYSWKGTFHPPFDWKTALRFEGAWDMAFAKHVFEEYDMFEFESCDMVMTSNNEIKMAANRDMSRFAIYLPYATDINIKLNLERYDVTLINLNNRFYGKPEIIAGKEFSTIKLYQVNADMIVIGNESKT
ncbi:MAG: DUF4038 domain-containing protein [Clostridia bacterium]|nr:DUF4038 domain-containing protein [Clostridia bacterium]